MEVYDSRERRLPYRRTAHSLTFRLTSSLCSQKTKNIQQSRFAGGHPCLGIPKYDWNNSGFFLYSAILILYGEIYLQVLFPTFSPTIISHPHDFSFINTHYTASSVRVRTWAPVDFSGVGLVRTNPNPRRRVLWSPPVWYTGIRDWVLQIRSGWEWGSWHRNCSGGSGNPRVLVISPLVSSAKYSTQQNIKL